MTNVYLHTFGCKANQYDTEVVRQALESAGATVVDDLQLADTAVVNSCTVTHTSEAKMRGFVRRIARKQPGVRTLVMGCATALDDGAIAALPGVARVVGGANPEQILAALGLDETPVDRLLRRFTRGSRAFLKIQDGCDEHCTFCATTVARGPSRSRPESDIVAEALALSETTEEIVLTGVHIGAYGWDRPEKTSLSQLVDELVAKVPRTRFRLSSVEATEVDDRLVELMEGQPDRLAPHLHAPLQSGSDRVLKRMGRHWYTAREYRDRIERIAVRLRLLGLGADVMVGFPGETSADHRATRSLMEDLPFTYAHVFPYSQRPDAPAGQLGPPVEPAATFDRSRELRELVARKGRAYGCARDGQAADTVLLQRRNGRFDGLTGDYLSVSLPTDSTHPPRRFTGRLRQEAGGLRVDLCSQ